MFLSARRDLLAGHGVFRADRQWSPDTPEDNATDFA